MNECLEYAIIILLKQNFKKAFKNDEQAFNAGWLIQHIRKVHISREVSMDICLKPYFWYSWQKQHGFTRAHQVQRLHWDRIKNSPQRSRFIFWRGYLCVAAIPYLKLAACQVSSLSYHNQEMGERFCSMSRKFGWLHIVLLPYYTLNGNFRKGTHSFLLLWSEAFSLLGCEHQI